MFSFNGIKNLNNDGLCSFYRSGCSSIKKYNPIYKYYVIVKKSKCNPLILNFHSKDKMKRDKRQYLMQEEAKKKSNIQV